MSRRSTRSSSLTTQMLTALTRRTTGVSSVQELRRARDVLRFGGMFALTILVPALLLAYLSLSTIRSEELFLDAEYRSRATAMTAELSREVDDLQADFTSAIELRLQRGESLLDRLADLSPYLRGVYRFSLDGELTAPFQLEPDVLIPPPPTRYVALHRAAVAHEVAREWTQAAEAYAEATRVAREPLHEAEARLGEARSWARAGQEARAEDLLTALYSDHATLRDGRGFRIGDLAMLLLVEMRQARTGDPADSVKDLVDRLLQETWSIGRTGEATIADRALTGLAGNVEPDWLAGRRADLNARASQHAWAGEVRNQLGIVAAAPTQEGQVRFLASALASPAVWATLGTDHGTYAFSFSRDAIVDHLVRTLDRMNEREEGLVARLLRDEQPVPDDAVTVAPLSDPLPYLRVVVSTAEPAQLANIAARRRVTRVSVVLVSVFLVVVGVWFSARTIGQEMESARTKADFAANVSHELRSPITQIRLKAEALQLGLCEPGDDTQRHYDAIVNEAERLSRLVDNVLDFAAIERGAKKYHLRAEDLASVVWTTVEANRNAVESQGLTLDLELPDDLPPVWLDREAIGQVVVNLLSNAVKYGSQGGWVGVAVRKAAQRVELSVSDRGMGIAPGDLVHIFDHFYRSSDTRVRRQKGTGIGLTIVSYIVEAHGGTISVDSALDRGTTFTVSFPIEPTTLEPHGEDSPGGAGAAT